MGKVNFDSTREVWENRTFQSPGFLHIWPEAEIHTVPKTWEKRILIVQGKVWEISNIQKL